MAIVLSPEQSVMKRYHPARAPRFTYVLLPLLLAALACLPHLKIRASSIVTLVDAGPKGKPFVNVQTARRLELSYTGDARTVSALQAEGKPVSLASADFDADGAPDLVAGYTTANGGVITVTRGNPDAFAPTDTSLYAKAARGEVPPTFMPTAAVYAVPGSPDFLATDDFDRDGYKDLLVGTSGGALYLLKGDGRGNLGAPTLVPLPAEVTALDVTPAGHLAVATDGYGGPQLMVLAPSAHGFKTVGSFILPSVAKSVVWGTLGGGADIAVGSGSNVVIVYGALTAKPQTETVSLSTGVQALAVGEFIWNRGPLTQISVLGADGVVHILQHGPLDIRPFAPGENTRKSKGRVERGLAPPNPTAVGPWAEVKQIPASIGAVSGEARPVFAASRLAGNGMMVVDAGQSQLKVLDATGQSAKPLGAIAFDSAPVAAFATPQKINAGRSLVVLTAGAAAPMVVEQSGDPSYTVNTTSDSDAIGACTNALVTTVPTTLSLREAVCLANNNASSINTSFTINIGPGTYDLSLNTGGETGELLMDPSGTGYALTIMGTGTAANTIIKQTDGEDRIIEEDYALKGNNPLTIENVTLSGGSCIYASPNDCWDADGGELSSQALLPATISPLRTWW